MAEASSSPGKTTLLQIPQGLTRPHSGDLEFDSGINTSAAWTVSLTSPDGDPRFSLRERSRSPTGASSAVPILGVEGGDNDVDASGSVEGEAASFDADEVRPARALYTFQGKAEFRELTNIEAGDELEVLREDVGEGWSLARLAKAVRETDSVQDGGEMGLIPRSYYIVRANTFLP